MSHRNRINLLPPSDEELSSVAVQEPQTVLDAFDDLPPGERCAIEIAAETRPGGVFMEHLLQFTCLSCRSAIPKEMVVGQMAPPNEAGRVQRVFRAYCEHCHMLHEVTTTLRSGVWCESGMTTIRDHRSIRAHFGNIATMLPLFRRRALKPRRNPNAA